MSRRKGVSDGTALLALLFIMFFFGLVLRFGGALGSIISGIFGLLGIVKGTAIPPFNISLLYVIELILGIVIYVGGAYFVASSNRFELPDGFWKSMRRTAVVIGVATVLFAISGTLEGFGLRFSRYVGGEGLIFVSVVGFFKDLFRFLFNHRGVPI